MSQYKFLTFFPSNLQVALKSARDNESLMDQKLLYKYLVDALRGLRYCHDKGYVHRNLTSYSMLVVDKEMVKLCEFGHCVKQASNEIAVGKF